jgi:acetyl-CoA C-acetyltransferase
MHTVSIVEAIRTPFGKLGGKLKQYSAVELGGLATLAALQRSGIRPEEITESIFGSALLAASTSVAARQINFKAGIPADTPSLTLDRACCSAMTTIGLGATKIRAGEAEVILAGGIESCSQTPFLMRGVRAGRRLGDFTVEDPLQLRNPINQMPIAGVTGTQALKFGVSREQQDAWAYRSHMTYFAAHEKGVYADEIVPVDCGDGTTLAIDESPRRDASLERLAALPTVYGGPTVTAGNAPGLNDGAAAVLLMSGEAARARGLEPLGEIVSYAQLCGDLDSSVYMPGKAIMTALAKAGIPLSEIKRIEINEAFAAMPLVSTLHMANGDVQQAEKLRAITNVNGGSVALGHPTGASGARVVMALARELKRLGGGYGAAAICGGYGQADALILKV